MKKDSLQMKNGKLQIEVFYLKQPLTDSFLPHPTEPNTWIINDEEVAKALIEDNLDCCEELHSEDLCKPVPLCAPSVHDPTCCPVGEKGESGETGMYEEELVIKKTLDTLADTQLNMSSEAARIFLAREIAKDLRGVGMLPYIPF